MNKVSQYLHYPIKEHWTVIKQILHYLQHILHHGLLLIKSNTQQLNVYMDVDWANNIDDRKSTTGYEIFMDNNLIS